MCRDGDHGAWGGLLRPTTRLLWLVTGLLDVPDDDRGAFVLRVVERLVDALCLGRPPRRLGPWLVHQARSVAPGPRSGAGMSDLSLTLGRLSDDQLVVLAVHLYFPETDHVRVGGLFGVPCGPGARRQVLETLRALQDTGLRPRTRSGPG